MTALTRGRRDGTSDHGPGAEPALRPALTEPFRGSPAAHWGDGVAGITVPAAKPAGWMNATQVERALEQSEELVPNRRTAVTLM
ncbi:hypothetical protein [Streptomyces sp.]|uniref:hypothetical protein n=1 Tax=Streptomyces sp. TaxID=1931 RepID=UPI002D6C787D|nr:hypothetical protein [Streptomyces sp.]HZF91882.1 hypothetical protein [Streptomyces sp.]